MTKAEIIANELIGLDPITMADTLKDAFGIVHDAIPLPEHPTYGAAIDNVGINITHDENHVIATAGICKRKKNPNNE